MVCVAWNGMRSQYFLATNGVKQGGVLSPMLYLLYIDGLLVKLSTAGVGCYFDPIFVGVLAYADDLLLLAPTPLPCENCLLFVTTMHKNIVLNSTQRNQNG